MGRQHGDVVELVDTQHSKCCAFGRVGSTPTIATTQHPPQLLPAALGNKSLLTAASRLSCGICYATI